MRMLFPRGRAARLLLLATHSELACRHDAVYIMFCMSNRSAVIVNDFVMSACRSANTYTTSWSADLLELLSLFMSTHVHVTCLAPA